MATHDYSVANDTGANVRADINNALSAIVSNNSSATEPSTTFAYQWWADTANDLLKQRNAANNAWISILTLSTGVPSTIAGGTSGQVLTSNGAGAAPSMQDAAGGTPGIDDNATSTAITIDSSGRVTMPSQPAFAAKLSTAQLNLAVGSHTTILFDTEEFDQGSDFNTGTYTFTAPVSGRYQFNVHLYLTNVDSANTEYIDLILQTSNKAFRIFFDPQQQLNADAGYLSLTLSVLADMDAADTAYVQSKQYNGTQQMDVEASFTTFSSYLVA